MQAEPKTAPGTQTSRRYRSIVDRIERLALARTGEPIHIPDLCADAGIGERALRDAFRVVYRCPPYRWLRTFRMNEARKALLSPSPRATVTGIAMHYGFFELGRFSVEYRRMFGECPSITLRRALVRTEAPAPVVIPASVHWMAPPVALETTTSIV